MSAARWWYVEANGRLCGRVHATEAELRAALGPHVTFNPNGLCLVWARPSGGAK